MIVHLSKKTTDKLFMIDDDYVFSAFFAVWQINSTEKFAMPNYFFFSFLYFFDDEMQIEKQQ
jgi:hypothetical protein